MNATPKTVRDNIVATVASGAWQGYTNQTITNTTTVTNSVAVQTAVNNFATNSPNVWNEVLLDNGDYSAGIDLRGNFGTTVPQFNLSTGGCIIRPKVGASPQLTGLDNWMSGVGIHVQGVTHCGYSTTRDVEMVRILQTSPRAQFVFENCKFGMLYAAGKTTADWALYPYAVKVECAETLVFKNNELYGLFECFRMSGVRYCYVYNNDFRLVSGFGMHFNPDVLEGSATTYSGGVWLHCVANVDRGNWYDNATDYTEASLPHRDIIQCLWAASPAPLNKLNLVAEDNVYISPCQTSITAAGGGKLSMETNLLQTTDSSNAGTGDVVLFNNLGASYGFLSQDGGVRNLYYDCNSVVGPNVVRPGPSDGVSNAWAEILSVGNSVYSNKNVAALIAATNGNSVVSTNDVIAQNLPSANSPNRLSDQFQGTFTQNANNFWVWDLGGTVDSFTKDAIRAKIIAQYVPKAGVTAGATFS